MAPPESWFRALNLSERRDLNSESSTYAAVPGEEADREALLLWRKLPVLQDEPSFDSLLRFYRLSEHQFIKLLKVPSITLADCMESTPSWLKFAMDSYDCPFNCIANSTPPNPFLVPVQPIAIEGGRRLQRTLSELEGRYKQMPFMKQQLVDEYYAFIWDYLLEVVMRAAVVEMHIARRLGALHQHDSSARFVEFCGHLAKPYGVRAFLELYPVVVRIASTQVLFTISAITEMVERVCLDKHILDKYFSINGDGLGALKTFTLGLGDSHRGGRTVTCLEFQSGSRVIYKPRSLRSHLLFNQVLSLISEKVSDLPFKLPIVVDRGAYGFMEFVEAHTCASQHELKRFFYRHGVQLALLHVMGGTDLHYENVVAHGEYPILVDLETILTPTNTLPFLGPCERLANKVLQESVLATGLLPRRTSFGTEREFVDISGIGGGSAQATPFLIPAWHAAGTDMMHLRREKGLLPHGENRPTLPQEQLEVLEFLPELISGFSDAYRAVRDNKDEVSDVLSHCIDVPVRIVLRHTHQYSFVHAESYHPYYLADATDRDRCFDQLWTKGPRRQQDDRVYEAEKKDLWNEDIPVFVALPNSRSLWTSYGEEIPEYFEHNGITNILARLNDLTDDNLARQVLFINISVASSIGPEKVSGAIQKCKLDGYESPIAAALAIADYICRCAVVSESEATWITIRETQPGYFEPAIAGSDFYSGLSGIVLYLGYLGWISGNATYTELAQKGLNRLILSVRDGGFTGIGGGLGGRGGVLYALTLLSVIFPSKELGVTIQRCIDEIVKALSSDLNPDIVSGASGCLLALLANYSVSGNCLSIEAAEDYGKLLLSKIVRLSKEQCDAPHEIKGMLQDGFGHGYLGIIYALHQLHSCTNRNRYKAPVENALTSLSNADSNIRSKLFRGLPRKWCRGLSGCIGALIRMAHGSACSPIVQEVARLMEQGFQSDPVESDCMCHGELGNLNSLLNAELFCSDGRRSGLTTHYTSKILMRARTEGWCCGVPVESPGLMDGMSGIGYQLLRLTNPIRVPDILLMDPPSPMAAKVH
jgi:type 2 lantibiotic biosynthesis protein LanM